MGTHVTLVKSSSLDQKWTKEQLKYMQLGGNAKATAFFKRMELIIIKQNKSIKLLFLRFIKKTLKI